MVRDNCKALQTIKWGYDIQNNMVGASLDKVGRN